MVSFNRIQSLKYLRSTTLTMGIKKIEFVAKVHFTFRVMGETDDDLMNEFQQFKDEYSPDSTRHSLTFT